MVNSGTSNGDQGGRAPSIIFTLFWLTISYKLIFYLWYYFVSRGRVLNFVGESEWLRRGLKYRNCKWMKITIKNQSIKIPHFLMFANLNPFSLSYTNICTIMKII